MNFHEYQNAAHKTAQYPEELGLIYPVMKLAGEAGEVAEKVGKMLRDGTIYLDDIGGVHVHEGMSKAQTDELVKELGDVLWYVAEIATVLNLGLGEIARRNIDKLADRSFRSVIIGEGDNR